MINLKYSAALLLVGSSLAWANAPTTGIDIDSTSIGIDKSIQVNNYIAATVDGGGEFTGTLTGTTGTVGFWCVDDQEAFYFGESGLANVTNLSSVATINSSATHYGNVTDTSTPSWTNGTGTILANATTADDRYTLAAYLISQYTGFDTSIAPTAQDDAIQEAIWAITNTTATTASDPAIYENGFSTLGTNTGVTSVDYWVEQALANAGNAVDTSAWAVVSWGANASGTLYDGSYAATDGSGNPVSSNQTFLVELSNPSTVITHNNNLAPEPGFYGLLTVAVTGLLFAVRRRNKA